MTTLERLEGWKQAGIISDSQFGTLAALVRKERFSLFLELNALLYLGVVALVTGLGWTVRTHFERLGDVFILAVLTIMFAAGLYYCFTRGAAYSNGEVESPDYVFDFVLYFACLLLSVELGYIEFRYAWSNGVWDNYLLFSSVVFFTLAYRFDNRFVLALALSSLGGFFGLKVSGLGFSSSESLRLCALAYAAVIGLAGTLMHRQEIKKHFLETYLHIAANVAFIAVISGLSGDAELLFLLELLVLAAASIALGIRYGRFAFVVYGIVFGYIGISMEVLETMRELAPILWYLVMTGSGVILLVVLLARRIGKEA